MKNRFDRFKRREPSQRFQEQQAQQQLDAVARAAQRRSSEIDHQSERERRLEIILEKQFKKGDAVTDGKLQGKIVEIRENGNIIVRLRTGRAGPYHPEFLEKIRKDSTSE